MRARFACPHCGRRTFSWWQKFWASRLSPGVCRSCGVEVRTGGVFGTSVASLGGMLTVIIGGPLAFLVAGFGFWYFVLFIVLWLGMLAILHVAASRLIVVERPQTKRWWDRRLW